MNTKALYDISYGLYVVASKMGDKFNGQIANTVIQVCSEPVKISVAINKNNYTHEFITNSKAFSVSILAKDRGNVESELAVGPGVIDHSSLKWSILAIISDD